jgi:cation diffusion facilitator CzcD-associated flavoprotein CzcO
MTDQQQTWDVAIIGAGISGIYALKQLRDAGFSAIALEAAPHHGGTWYWNSYPGARVDIESIEFSFKFDPELEQDWTWSSRYATQPELLRYLDHVVERYDLAPHIRLGVRVAETVLDDADTTWRITAESGERFVARHVVLATGALSAPKTPVIEGLDTFEGDILRSVRWPAGGYDLTGKKVGVIGTGSTGVQIITAIAPELGDNLYVLQRTAPFVVPAHNGPLSTEFVASIKTNYRTWREAEQEHFGGFVAVNYEIGTSPTVTTFEATEEERWAEFEKRWNSGGLCFYSSFSDLLFDVDANRALAEYLQHKTREQVAGHPMEETFIPRDYMPLTRRLIVEDGYYESYTVHGANLIDVGNGNTFEVVPNGVKVNGELVELDALILATGFEGVIGAPRNVDIRGTDGIALKDAWQDAPSTLLGYLIHGFPNMYLINGAGCPGALTQAFTLSEFQVEWVRDLLVYAREQGHDRIEASPSGQAAWTQHLDEVLKMTLFPYSASWYLGSNVEGRKPMPMLYLGGFPAYKRHSLEQRDRGFPDLVFDGDTERLRKEPAFTL